MQTAARFNCCLRPGRLGRRQRQEALKERTGRGQPRFRPDRRAPERRAPDHLGSIDLGRARLRSTATESASGSFSCGGRGQRPEHGPASGPPLSIAPPRWGRDERLPQFGNQKHRPRHDT
jgi:hypothetical protein